MRFQWYIVSAVILFFVCLQQSFAADLSPKKWKPTEKRRAEKLEMSPFAPQPRIVEGRSALISNTGSPIAVHAGIEALRQGGTAADAAATVALTHCATVLGSYISYAGIAQLLYYEAKSGKIYSMGAGWNSYRGENDPKTIPSADLGPISGQQSTGGAEGRKTLVPGFMSGIEAMQKRFGRLPFAELLQPAIWYAENGITVSPLLASYFNMQGKFLSRTPEGRQFMQQGGTSTPKSGDRFVQAELARTLRGVATQGAKSMYAGDWGRQFVEAVRREGGKATTEDMVSYEPIWAEPLATTFAGNSVYVPGQGNQGGQQVLEALNLAEQLQLDQGDPYWKDWKSFRDLSRILQFVAIGPYVTPEVAEYQRRNGLIFSPEDRIAKAYAKAMAPMIGEAQSQGLTPQTPHHSAALVVIDRWGNVAALVHSINAVLWGSTGIVVGGIPLSGAAGFQQARLAAIKPGDHVPDDMAPAIVLNGKRPTLATASVGTSEIYETVRILLGILGNHVNSQTIMAAPTLLYNFEPPQAGETYTWKRQFVPEGAYDKEFLTNLEASGVKIQQVPRTRVLTLKGTTAVGTVDPKSGIRSSVEDPAIIGFADGY